MAFGPARASSFLHLCQCKRIACAGSKVAPSCPASHPNCFTHLFHSHFKSFVHFSCYPMGSIRYQKVPGKRYIFRQAKSYCLRIFSQKINEKRPATPEGLAELDAILQKTLPRMLVGRQPKSHMRWISLRMARAKQRAKAKANSKPEPKAKAKGRAKASGKARARAKAKAKGQGKPKAKPKAKSVSAEPNRKRKADLEHAEVGTPTKAAKVGCSNKRNRKLVVYKGRLSQWNYVCTCRILFRRI